MNLLKKICCLFSITSVLNTLEGIYYIAFIILTTLTLLYVIKQYHISEPKQPALYCKVHINQTDVTNGSYPFFLEVYNYGDGLASNIHVSIFDSCISIIDFLKPNESEFVILGDVIKMHGGNIISSQYPIEQDAGKCIPVSVTYLPLTKRAKPVTKSFDVSTSILSLQSEICNNSFANMDHSLRSIAKSLMECLGAGAADSFVDTGNSLQKYLDKISKAINEK